MAKKPQAHDPQRHEGARLERAAVRRHLRRLLKTGECTDGQEVVKDLLEWVLDREKRYAKRPGGL